MSIKRSHEPVFWSLFGAGGVVVAFILPVLVLATGLAIPFDLLSPEQLSYDRVLYFTNSWIGKCFIFATVSLSFWHGLHRIFLSLHDLGVHNYRYFYKWLCYGLAACGTASTLILIV